MNVYVTFTSPGFGGVFVTEALAKQSWVLSYSSIGKPKFIDTTPRSIVVLHPNSNERIGIIRCEPVRTEADHL